jgi:hypothetical protein
MKVALAAPPIARPRVMLWLLFALGVVIIWAPPRPPMVDLPQHAAQIALLRDLALGRSPWAHDLRINLFTPYLIGYGLAFPLALVMPVAAAIKSVLTLAFAGFVGMALVIRRELDASPRLDAYYFIPFFGFSYGWGLYTFLVAAPVGLAFIWLSIRYTRWGGAGRAAGLAALGVAMIFTHVLVCLFASGVGLLMLFLGERSPIKLLARSWPFAAPIIMCAVFLLITRQPSAAGRMLPHIGMGPLAGRIEFNLSGGFEGFVAPWAMLASVLFAAFPFLGGLRLSPRRECLAIIGPLLAILLLTPVTLDWVGAIYPRFTLFLPPAYAWVFSDGEPTPQDRIGGWVAPRLPFLTAAIAAAVLAWHIVLAIAFANESRDFDAILARAAPGQRALALMFDEASATGANPSVYMHFPQWYVVEKQGFVDFTFAVYHPQIARLAAPPSPVDADDTFQWSPHFDWRRDDAGRYRYIFVRSARPLPANLFTGAPCPPALVAASGPWLLFERRTCVPGGSPRNSVR